MATQSFKRTDLVGLTSLSFIRPQRISFNIVGTKPSTVMYAFFDGVDVSKYVTPTGGSLGDVIVSDASGNVTGTFDIPPMTFNTGSRIFLVQDSSTYDITAVPGNTVGTAQAVFSASGLLRTFQETVTNVETINNVITKVNVIEQNIIDAPPPASVEDNPGGDGGGTGDPLAQTFFTYGVTGGCFITSIEVFFATKDGALPITCEIRNTVNGYPGSSLVSKFSSKTIPSSSVGVSTNASVATKFTFDRPIYLEEDNEYCFVLKANSNNYNVWTSEFGKTSIETGKTIFEQPFIGTLFKSENNVTWSAEQTEDIKFNMYKANFFKNETSSTITKEIVFKANAPTILIPGSNLTVTSGSSLVTAVFDTQHGHRTNDKIVLTGLAGANYRGIPSATISNTSGFDLNVVDDYTVTFTVTGAVPTSSGTLETSGILNSIAVLSGGTNYSSPTITITGGTGATATATVVSGSIVDVTITNAGSGFVSKPVVTITDPTGTGCKLEGISEAIFVVSMNKKFQNVVPVVDVFQPTQTRIVNSIRTTSEDYSAGSYELHAINVADTVSKNAVLMNAGTEAIQSGGNASTSMILRMESDNPNVSPVINLADRPRLRCHNFLINSDSNAASEISPAGTAMARYISSVMTLETTSHGIRAFVNAASVNATSFDVFVRTSMSSPTHKTKNWVALQCDVERNQSATWDEYKDYEFYLDDIEPFNAYDIKIVLYSNTRHLFPKIANYRAIVLAS